MPVNPKRKGNVLFCNVNCQNQSIIFTSFLEILFLHYYASSKLGLKQSADPKQNFKDTDDTDATKQSQCTTYEIENGLKLVLATIS